jgi:hypothetical protein
MTNRNKTSCVHKQRKTTQSYAINPKDNLLVVTCTGCGMYRYEARYETGRVDAFKWAKKR